MWVARSCPVRLARDTQPNRYSHLTRHALHTQYSPSAHIGLRSSFPPHPHSMFYQCAGKRLMGRANHTNIRTYGGSCTACPINPLPCKSPNVSAPSVSGYFFTFNVDLMSIPAKTFKENACQTVISFIPNK